MDYRLYHAVNEFVAAHSWIGRVAASVESWAIPLFAIATLALWLGSRPGTARKWKLACTSALASAGLALLFNQLVAQVWFRDRPFASHPDAAVWGSRSGDPSFPSDHASAAFAIAVAVLLFDRAVGSLFLAAAVAVSVGRVLTGVHYPADVVAAALVGTACAAVVVRAGRPLAVRIVSVVERVTDPIVQPLWLALGRDGRGDRG
ncbi:PAP2 superfamily [Gaiella occulta]|uniref:PAP2 superfamily n=1 Tax=Gaiella occulta TaxID=1002870 RepID=A0A7M2Z259_9ACTN|nr:phosphatase PAP2 family protein [Gaiella occulta]RDI76195.1 PAP2 superfamily [Gaiella occulta]